MLQQQTKADTPFANWTPAHFDRFYELYLQYIARLKADVIDSNRSMGSKTPEKTKIGPETKEKVDRQLRNVSTDDPEVAILWVRRVVRGFEKEFPPLPPTPNHDADVKRLLRH